MNFDELLKELQERKIKQVSDSWEENFPEDLWDAMDGNYSFEEDELNIDKHRHYEQSTTVICYDGRHLGMRHISNVYSESCGVEDIGNDMYFFEMKEVQTTTYVEIKEEK